MHKQSSIHQRLIASPVKKLKWSYAFTRLQFHATKISSDHYLAVDLNQCAMGQLTYLIFIYRCSPHNNNNFCCSGSSIYLAYYDAKQGAVRKKSDFMTKKRKTTWEGGTKQRKDKICGKKITQRQNSAGQNNAG